MRAARLLAAVAVTGLAASQTPSLSVLRFFPSETAQSTDVVTVTFDRPVAGQLDGTVDPRAIFTIAPAVAELFAASGPATPSIAPWPNCSGWRESCFSTP